MSRLLRAAAVAAALLAMTAAPALAQRLRIAGGDGSRAVAVARQVLQRDAYLRIDRDTTLAADFRHAGDLVVFDAEVALEGTVEGTVVVVGGSLFIRPGARIAGPVAVVGGGAFGSALAEHGEILETSPGTIVTVDADAISVEGVDAGAFVEFQPARPVLSLRPSIPTYDRVSGVTLTGGVRLRPFRRDDRTVLDAWVSVFADREEVGGGARLEVPLGGGLVASAEASRAVRTNDAWQRDDLQNTVSTLFLRNDYRDYWESDRYAVMLGRPLRAPLIAGESWLGPRLGAMISDDRSLRAREVWALFEDDDRIRPNPPIDEGRIVSVFAGGEAHWVGNLSRLSLDAQVEHALPGESDFGFTQLVVDGRYRTVGLFRHQLLVAFHGMAALGPKEPPAQREGVLGGRGTLATVEIGGLRGHNLGWVETTYAIPVERVELPFLGPPQLELIHAAGSAWNGSRSPRWTQNVGAGVRTSVLLLRAFVDPSADDIDPVFVFGFTLPG